MEWLWIALFAALLWAFFNANVFWRRRRRSDISHAIRSLLLLLEDGGWLSIKERGSPIVVRVVREKNVGRAATLILQVPNAPWSLPSEEKLRKLCDGHGYQGKFESESATKPLCEIHLPVEDIWSESAGAPGARLVNLVLDAVGGKQDARFKLDLVGRRSRRLVDRGKALRKSEAE